MKNTNEQYLPDGAWLRYYEEDGQTWTIQHSEAFDGRPKLDPAWEVVEEAMGKIYIVKPKKIKDENEADSKN